MHPPAHSSIFISQRGTVHRPGKVIVLAAAGDHFSAGHDLKEIKALKDLRPKLAALYAALSADQKKKADQMLATCIQ